MFKQGAVNSGLGHLKVFCINLVQNDNISVKTNADDNINSLCGYAIPRYYRKQFKCLVNENEKKHFFNFHLLKLIVVLTDAAEPIQPTELFIGMNALREFMSMNSSLGCIGSAASHIFPYYSSYM